MKKQTKFFDNFFNGAAKIAKQIDTVALEKLTNQIKQIKNKNGRIFFRSRRKRWKLFSCSK